MKTQIKISKFRIKMAFKTLSYNRYSVSMFFDWFDARYNFVTYESGESTISK